jgi:putative ATP-dependent endonuclease of OLD family
MAFLAPGEFKRLDSLGWVPFDAGGETNVASFAAFFRQLGKTVAAIFDQQLVGARAAIAASCDRAFEQPYAGFEHLLRAEVQTDMQSWFVKWLVDSQEWPHALAGIVPPEGSANEAYIEPFMTLMRHKKGDDYLTLFFDQCQVGHMPASIVHTLRSLREMVEGPAAHPVLPLPFIVPPVA